MPDADDAVAAHRETVRAFARPGGPFDSASPHATVNNPRWFAGLTAPRASRRLLHTRLIGEYRDRFPGARADRQAIVLAGPPGAGKSTALEEMLGKNLDAWLKIDPDEFKKMLLTEAIKDGTYESVIKPPEVKEREAAGEPFFPLELASLVHAESSLLAATLRRTAIDEGVNVVIDTVLSKPDAAVELGQMLERANYSVQVLDVEVSFALSAERIARRWHEAYSEALVGADPLGGRWVPSEYAREVFTGPESASRSEESARQLAQSCGSVTRYRVLRTTQDMEDAARARGERAVPKVEVDLARVQTGGPLVDYAAAAARRAALPGVTRARTSHPTRQPGHTGHER